MENHKFYYDGNYKFATLDDIDCIITDSMPPDDIKNIIDELNIELL